MIRKTLMWPMFCATFKPVAMVRAGRLRFDVGGLRIQARTIGVLAMLWTQTIRGRSGPTRPSASSSSNALAMPTTPVPPPVG